MGCYQRLQVAASLESSENRLHLQGPRRAAISQLATALSLRIQVCNMQCAPPQKCRVNEFLMSMSVTSSACELGW